MTNGLLVLGNAPALLQHLDASHLLLADPGIALRVGGDLIGMLRIRLNGERTRGWPVLNTLEILTLVVGAEMMDLVVVTQVVTIETMIVRGTFLLAAAITATETTTMVVTEIEMLKGTGDMIATLIATAVLTKIGIVTHDGDRHRDRNEERDGYRHD